MMFTAILLFCILLATIYLLVREAKETRRLGDKVEDLAVDLESAEKDYNALEQGMDEQSEAYEMQILSLQEIVQTQAQALHVLKKDLHIFKAWVEDLMPHVNTDEVDCREVIDLVRSWNM